MKDLRLYIKKMGGSVKGLAEYLGVSVQTVHYHMRRDDEMSVAELERICEYVGGDITDLFEPKKPKAPGFVALVSRGGVSYRFDSEEDLRRAMASWAE